MIFKHKSFIVLSLMILIKRILTSKSFFLYYTIFCISFAVMKHPIKAVIVMLFQ